MNNIPIHIINLKKSTDRWNNVNQLMKKYNIKVNRFEAIYGKELDYNYIKDNTSIACNYLLCNYGIIGCALSHINLWQQLINDNNNDNYIIIEDDFLDIDIKNLDNLTKYITKNNLDFDMIRLICISSFLCKSLNNDKIFITNDLYLKKSIFSLSACGYIISKNGAIKLINEIKKHKINYHIDFSISAYNILNKNMKIYNTNKNLITLNNELTINSTISKKYRTILFYILEKFKLYNLNWYLNVPVLTLFRKFEINVYFFLLIIILLINNKNKHKTSKILINLFIFFEICIIIYYNIIKIM